MSDYLLIDGDQAMFTPSFGAATVIVQPGRLMASGPATVNGRKVCIAGDEGSVSVAGCSYLTASHPIPGTVTLQIASLAGDQMAGKTRSGTTAVLLVGSSFTAAFVVQSPAQQPTPGGSPVPDPTPRYTGTGTFVTANTRFKGV